MKHLVYAVCADSGPVGPLPAGPEGTAVDLVVADGLAAACSSVPDVFPPGPAPLLLYAAVVEALHAVRTVLPLRFGCLLRDEAGVQALLRERGSVFRAALAELEGCEEMGIRVLLGGAPAAPGRVSAPTGAAYLAACRARFAAREQRQAQVTATADRLRAAFGPLVLRLEAGPAPAEPSLPQPYHALIRRADRERFRAAFRALEANERGQCLLTGPWPPYHFAARTTS